MQSWSARPGYREITVAPVKTASWMFEIESSGWRPNHMIRTSHPWSAGPLVTVTSVRAKALLRLGHSQTDDSACYTEGLSSDFQVLDRYTKHCKQPWTRSLSWPPRQRRLERVGCWLRVGGEIWFWGSDYVRKIPLQFNNGPRNFLHDSQW